jgi:hypothetical protein
LHEIGQGMISVQNVHRYHQEQAAQQDRQSRGTACATSILIRYIQIISRHISRLQPAFRVSIWRPPLAGHFHMSDVSRFAHRPHGKSLVLRIDAVASSAISSDRLLSCSEARPCGSHDVAVLSPEVHINTSKVPHVTQKGGTSIPADTFYTKHMSYERKVLYAQFIHRGVRLRRFPTPVDA